MKLTKSIISDERQVFSVTGYSGLCCYLTSKYCILSGRQSMVFLLSCRWFCREGCAVGDYKPVDEVRDCTEETE